MTMAAAAIPRFLLSSSNRLHLFRFPRCPTLPLLRLCHHNSISAATPHSLLSSPLPTPQKPSPLLFPPICCFSSNTNTDTNTNTNTNSTASFDWSDDDDDDLGGSKKKKTKEIDRSKLPPPYDPFSKKPVVEEPRDPSNLQEIFHKMRTEGLTNSAIKMFDALSKDGLTHEAMELFAVIKDKGNMPDVVAHTAVIEAYANAGGHSREAIRTFDRMLASGVAPNTYTYAVLIKGLARDGKLSDARKYLLEMMGKGMRSNAGTYLAVFEAYVREEKHEDARALLVEMRGKGFVPDEKTVREHLSKRGQVFRSIMSLLFG